MHLSPLKVSLLGLSVLAMSTVASAHPHDPEPVKKKVEVIVLDDMADPDDIAAIIEEKLSDHSVTISKSMAKAKRSYDRSVAKSGGTVEGELDAVANAVEEIFSDKGVFRDLAAMLGEFADDIELDTDDGATTLRFDGKTVGRIETQKSRDNDDSMSLSGLGKNLTIDRETVVENGKSRTRIVIEMDGGEGLDITLPDSSAESLPERD